MRVHHLNCGTFRPPLAPEMVAHVLLVERPEGLLLVDTGLGTTDLAHPARLGRPFRTVVRPALDPAETALAQVTALGFAAGDVTDVVLTHLDLDHVGGIGDFPSARVHVFEREYDAATRPALTERGRYVAAQWAHGPRWVLHAEPGDSWLGLPAVTALDDDVLLVPLPGHSRGHCGVAVRRDDGHWLVHAGDAVFDGDQLRDPPRCHRGLAAFQAMVAVDNKARRANEERLRELATGHTGEVTVFCAHDKAQLDALAGAAAGDDVTGG
ncbi:MBL fold metallo-hydrolase [Nocardioides sp. TF02-7]|uniref:MBL fold metallo-hydrolase n=1 Tax=Nocardioides sp. TF02-7 TaxID=2917724 RepID=UPI001F051F0B|nr:MBL fold metallo-hydrolase [Nocardioides sp. TF02-7]UMG94176.1 MBL fold metallo-hydrolase [Nocardioides sp. TF02-7]